VGRCWAVGESAAWTTAFHLVAPSCLVFFPDCFHGVLQVVSRLWAYIKEHNLQDPKDKRVILFGERRYRQYGQAAQAAVQWQWASLSASALTTCGGCSDLPLSLLRLACPVFCPNAAQPCRQPFPAPFACSLPACPALFCLNPLQTAS
jgi:hypothetical protein